MQDGTYNRIFVTGGTGFVGAAVIEELLSREYEVVALVHRGEPKTSNERLRFVRGDLFSDAAMDKGMAGCDAVIHLVGIIREIPRKGATFDRIHFHATRAVVESARRAGIRRYIQMSALGARQNAASAYHKTKFKAEQFVRDSDLEFTIFRPSLIHGPGGEFLKMEADWARGKRPPFFFMPYFGGGVLGLKTPTSLQPVYVKDVARAFAEALARPQTIGKTYCIGGSQKLTWPQMHHLAAEIFTGKRKAAIALPAWYASALTHLVPPKLLPFTRDQVIMAQEDSVCDMEPFIKDLGFEPGQFEQTLREYAAQV